jgi:HD-GYP domain-containing protein (c-di-GMP phosphodiesterase class II)
MGNVQYQYNYNNCISKKEIQDKAIYYCEKFELEADSLNLHCGRVAYICNIIGDKMELDDIEIRKLTLSAFLHDIGKKFIPTDILNKPSRLTTSEFEIMKTHSNLGYDLIVGMGEIIKDSSEIAEIVRHHHESFDGNGYPDRLKGNDIHLFSQIISIVDVFDALTNSRPYRNNIYFNPFIIMDKQANTKFNANVYHHLVKPILQNIKCL